MTYKEALDYISIGSLPGSVPGLERISMLTRALGSPETRLRFVHVAGTNGKGSTSSMLASVFRCAGYRTGLYTSPHLRRVNERMSVCGESIGDDAFAALISRVAAAHDSIGRPCTEFELLTAAALLFFYESGCEVCVLETGLGGRLDATNIIPSPDCAVITSIGLDHTEILGDSLALIAAEKAGIIKGGAVVASPQAPEAAEALAKAAAALGSTLDFADLNGLSDIVDTADGISFRYFGSECALSLIGEHQVKNAITAIAAVFRLRQQGYDIPEPALREGLHRAFIPARFERVSKTPPFIVDGGHNVQCIEAAAAALLRYYPNKRHIILCGVMADKDVGGMLDLLAPIADDFVATTPDNPRALPAADLAEMMKARSVKASAVPSVSDAVSKAIALAGDDGMVLCVGSLYMAGDVRACFGLY